MKIHWPKITIPEGFENAESYLRHLVYEGAKKRYKFTEEVNLSTLNERIESELNYLKGFEPYFILFYHLAGFCHKEGILIGPGYGSAASSIINYCLGITSVDPLWYLYAESFYLKGSSRMPQIIIQIDPSKEEDIIDYLKSTYGENHVLRTGVGYRRNLEKKLSERVPVYGAHAFGICIFDRPYQEVVATIETERNDNGHSTEASCLTKEELESLGYVTIGIMGLKSLSCVHNTLELIKQKKNKTIEYDKISDDDPATFEFLSSGNKDLDNIWCSNGFADYLSDVKPSFMAELCTVNSLWTRPLYHKRDFYRELVEEDKDEDLFDIIFENFGESTRGLILYHESITLILSIMSNLSLEECEKIRRFMRYPDQKPIMETFLNSVKNLGLYDIREAEKIWCYFMWTHKNTVSMAHYLSLTIMWYRATWLRVHYPEEFKECYP